MYVGACVSVCVCVCMEARVYVRACVVHMYMCACFWACMGA